MMFGKQRHQGAVDPRQRADLLASLAMAERSPSHSRSKKTIDAGLCRESSFTREAAG